VAVCAAVDSEASAAGRRSAKKERKDAACVLLQPWEHYARDRRKGERFGAFAILAGDVTEAREGRYFND
jgi:hypothetical protein